MYRCIRYHGAVMRPTPQRHIQIAIEVNGQAVERTVPTDLRLIDLLRDDLELTGTKEGCAVGVCGACTVLLDGQPVSACLLLAVQVDGRRLATIEGLRAEDGTLTPVQAAFIRHGGFQCGICTPGQVMAASALLAEDPTPDDDRIREWMTGNLCRCTGYYGIVASIRAAAGLPPQPSLRPPGPVAPRDPSTDERAAG